MGHAIGVRLIEGVILGSYVENFGSLSSFRFIKRRDKVHGAHIFVE